MFGDLKNLEYRGLIPRCTETIFETIKSGSVAGSTIMISCSYLEIYQEQIIDLLRPTNDDLQIREDPSKGVYVEGLHSEYVSSVVDVYSLMAIGDVSKKKASTKMNQNSSRSHCCFTIFLEQTNAKGQKCKGQLNLIDLAGSERISKTKASGLSLEQAKKINLSLTSLAQVINALAENASFVPYRQSKLTRLLQNSLGGNSKTSMVIACSPHPDNLEETISTLRFAERCALVKNRVKANTVLSAEELQEMLEKANREISKATAGHGKDEGRSLVDSETQTEDGELLPFVVSASIEGMPSEAGLESLIDLEAEIEAMKANTKHLQQRIEDLQLENDTLNQRLMHSNERLLNASAALVAAQKAQSQQTTQSSQLMPPPPAVKQKFGQSGGSRSMWFGRKDNEARRKSSTQQVPENKGHEQRFSSFTNFLIVPQQPPAQPADSTESNPTDVMLVVPEGADETAERMSRIQQMKHRMRKLSRLASAAPDDSLKTAAVDPANPPPSNIGDRSLTEPEMIQLPNPESRESIRLEDAKRQLMELQQDHDFRILVNGLEEQLATATQTNSRNVARCVALNDVVERQQKRLHEQEQETSILLHDKEALERDASLLRSEVDSLKSQIVDMMREQNRARDETGGAKIIVPLQQGSILQEARDQQALGQLGKVMSIFSFGFGGESSQENTGGVGDRMSKMFSSLNPFS
eukprot:c20261_g1_i2.p1 GENE.c20261_g1_i2~~c20261_g1_i2.p1  ORF type:complete len:696 (+),score=179.13 c20261_g1_i2:365-2452(+)